MQTEILGQAEHLEEEWWDLWRRDPHATPFQSPAWLLPWRRHFSEGDSLVLNLRQDGRLIGLLPLFRLDGRLMLWGAGTSDWLGGLLDPSVGGETLAQAFMQLEEPLDLFQLPAECLLMRSPAPEGWQERRGFSEGCAVLSLPARPSARMRQNLRYYRRRAEKSGLSEPEEVSAGELISLATLHTRRWSGRGEPGIFADPRFLAWQTEAAARLEAAGLLRLYALRMSGRIVAALYVLMGSDRAFYYIGGFDPALAKLGLGTILVGHAIAEAERAGLTAFDFLRGQEDYKYRWGAVDQPSFARYLAPKGAE